MKGAAALMAGATELVAATAHAAETVKVGLLHSMSGPVAIVELPVIDAEKLAIEEINASGGVLGKQVVAILEDGASNWPRFAEAARKLLEVNQVAAVFGCYTSASRKAVLPIFEMQHGLLYYPTYYEGLEQSPHIMYIGQEAAQSTIPAIKWLMKNKGKRFFLIGSDYIWPRTTNGIARTIITAAGGSIAGEEYFPLDSGNYATAIRKIRETGPDVILSTVVGSANIALYRELNAARINGKTTAIMALAVTEVEAAEIGAANVQGVLTCMSYFQSLSTVQNRRFVQAFRSKYGATRVIGDTMEAAYSAVYLWKKAVERARSFDVARVIEASAGMDWGAPSGRVQFHRDNHHLWKHTRIGMFRPDGQVDILFESPLVEPNPFPKL